MDQQGLYNRILRSLHEAVFDETSWPVTAGLIDIACGVKGNALVVAGGQTHEDLGIYFARFCYRGQRREDLEHVFFDEYLSRAEHVPRLRVLPAGLLVHAKELFTEKERQTSATYNEGMRLSDTRNSLNVRLDGPDGLRVVWVLADPVDVDGWRADRIRMIERLLPHVRQFVRVRHALIEAGALDKSLTGPGDVTGAAIIHLDRKGRIVAANDRANEILRQRDGLLDESGALHAVEPGDNADLQRLLARTLPPFREHGAGGSMTVGRVSTPQRLVLHVTPVGRPSPDSPMRRVAAQVLVVDPRRRLSSVGT